MTNSQETELSRWVDMTHTHAKMLFFGQALNNTSERSEVSFGCLHFGRHDIFTFFQNVGLLLYYYLKNKQTSDSVPIKTWRYKLKQLPRFCLAKPKYPRNSYFTYLKSLLFNKIQCKIFAIAFLSVIQISRMSHLFRLFCFFLNIM